MKNKVQKIFVFDVGNTLVEKASNMLAPELVNDLLSLQDKGSIIGLATMRNLAKLKEILIQVPFDFFIALNGAYVECKKEILTDKPIDNNILSKISSTIEKQKIEYLLYSKYEIHRKIQRKENYYGIELKNCNKEIYNIQKELPTFAFHIWENGKNCDIHSIDVSKSKGILEVCQYLDISIKNTVAFGDGFNDIELFKSCGLSIAMETAPDELKQIASFVTKSVSKNGVSYALNHLSL